MNLKPGLMAIGIFLWVTSIFAIGFFMDGSKDLSGFLIFTDIFAISLAVVAYFGFKDFFK